MEKRPGAAAAFAPRPGRDTRDRDRPHGRGRPFPPSARPGRRASPPGPTARRPPGAAATRPACCAPDARCPRRHRAERLAGRAGRDAPPSRAGPGHARPVPSQEDPTRPWSPGEVGDPFLPEGSGDRGLPAQHPMRQEGASQTPPLRSLKSTFNSGVPIGRHQVKSAMIIMERGLTTISP